MKSFPPPVFLPSRLFLASSLASGSYLFSYLSFSTFSTINHKLLHRLTQTLRFHLSRSAPLHETLIARYCSTSQIFNRHPPLHIRVIFYEWNLAALIHYVSNMLYPSYQVAYLSKGASHWRIESLRAQ